MIREIDTERMPGWVVVRLHGRVDAFTEKRTVDTLGEIVRKVSNHLVLDIEQVDFLSLSVLRHLVSLKKGLQSSGGGLVLINPHHNIKRQIEIFIGPKTLTWVKNLEDIHHLRFRAMLNQNNVEHLGAQN